MIDVLAVEFYDQQQLVQLWQQAIDNVMRHQPGSSRQHPPQLARHQRRQRRPMGGREAFTSPRSNYA
ncbi:MAG: hypothetical protein ACYC0H_23470 [Solirubrobacteraceae bacterium]